MVKTIVRLFLILVLLPAWGQPPSLVTVRRAEKLLGVTVEVTVTAEDEELGYINIAEALAEIRRVEALVWAEDPASEVSAINAAAGKGPVAVSPELFKLLKRAVQISELTSGSFDITAGALAAVWRFDGSMRAVPDPQEIAAVLPLVGYRRLQLNDDAGTIFLPLEGMKIDLGGIDKGYAADRAKEVMLAKQVPGGMINIGGQITAWGSKATGDKWLLGVSDPLRAGHIRAWIPLIESSVAMIRPEARFVQHNGITYGEVLNPANGRPASGVEQVTVLARSAELSHALATALCVLGPERGIRLAEQLGDTEAIVADKAGVLHYTSGLLLDIP